MQEQDQPRRNNVAIDTVKKVLVTYVIRFAIMVAIYVLAENQEILPAIKAAAIAISK
ncbi:hypothetical protein [Pseudaestuariivita rosea]|uniref:hypothetical protein n=1 Tax=Pseudaestuariivita rosea TaxID=2763263 RepID=UPI001ABB61B6|nr:hypothetical protein [Pseudaestuariivita rosea]